MANETSEELERFRNQWREEVTARTRAGTSSLQTGSRPEARRRSSARVDQFLRPPPAPSIAHDTKQAVHEDAYEAQTPNAYHGLEDKDQRRRLRDDSVEIYSSDNEKYEPQSALEHYEKAVEKETQGSLGDSLTHYRKAYRVRYLRHHPASHAHASYSSTTESIRSTRTSTSHLRRSPRNPPTQTRQTPLSQCLILPITPSTGTPPPYPNSSRPSLQTPSSVHLHRRMLLPLLHALSPPSPSKFLLQSSTAQP